MRSAPPRGSRYCPGMRSRGPSSPLGSTGPPRRGESWKFRLMGAITPGHGAQRHPPGLPPRHGAPGLPGGLGGQPEVHHLHHPPADESAGTSDYIKRNSERRTWSMNSPSEKNTSDSLLQALFGEEHPRPGGDPAETLHPPRCTPYRTLFGRL